MTSRTNDSKPVEFINYVPPGIDNQNQQRGYAVRVHAAKVGWQKSAKAAKIEARRRKSQETGERSIIKKSAPTTPERNEAVLYRVESRHALDTDNLAHIVGRPGVRRCTAMEVIPRTISPTLGASSIKTFDAGHYSMSSEAGVMLSTTIWPTAAGQAVSMEWFRDFCTSPVLYHAHCMAAASYRDFLANNFLWSGSRFALEHKTRAISLIRQQVERLQSMSAQDIEKLIFAIMILGGHELELRDLLEMDLLFSPHLPTTTTLRLWGRFEPVITHEKAAFALVRRQGGLHSLHSPGLATLVASTDMLRAASHLHKPLFPCHWNAHVVDALPENIDEEEFLTSDRRPGIGFFKLPGGLPQSAATVLAEVACLDRIMSTFQERTPTGHEFMTLLNARNATLHRLFSVPPWDDLTPEGRGTSHRAIYEICRITAVIYCNAVIFPIPPHNGWNSRATATLVELLTAARFDEWDVDVSGVHMWTLLIGGVAAQGTPQRPFFEHALRRWYLTHRQSWSAITAGLKGFIWSDRACKAAGAALLHRALFGSDSAEANQDVAVA